MSDCTSGMNMINEQALATIHASYIQRVHDFRKEQQAVIYIILGMYSLIVGKVLGQSTSSVNLDLSTNLSIISALGTWVLSVLYFNHAIMIALLAKKLTVIEKQLGMPNEASFFATDSKLRWNSFLVSLSLPMILHAGLAVFIAGTTQSSLLGALIFTVIDALFIAVACALVIDIKKHAISDA